MTRQVKARRATSRKPYQPRDFWLAGIGAASLARRQLLSAYAQLLDRAQDLREQSSRAVVDTLGNADARSEEHTSELQSLMRISYAVFCLKKKQNNNINKITHQQEKHTH